MPIDWWSRTAEYPWVDAFLKSDQRVLDAGCGVEHFFKYHLAERCRAVEAVDSDPDILKVQHAYENLRLRHGDISNLSCYSDQSFDLVVCISVLEHLPLAGIRDCLRELTRLVHSCGNLLITWDVPTVELSEMLSLVGQSSLKLLGPLFTGEPEDVLIEPGSRKLRVFRLVLVRR